ncbi:DUF3169 family protein [Paenibacillus fonticola]|uniref:DUF3169 family protein n=1 Tax=Paenibacillus fonticola TaxID=379896 RepID=UPI00037F41A0|nr:DUF3169 family protein [Paenibacillus fonticola]
MKIFRSLWFGGVTGLISVLLIYNTDRLNSEYAQVIIIGMLAIIALMFVLSGAMYSQVKKLNNKEVTGDEEDEIDSIKYKKFTDYSIFIQISLTLSIMSLCISIIMTGNMVLIILSVVSLLITFLFSGGLMNLMRLVYPHRSIPDATDANYSEMLLEIADDGEKHIMLQGLYKAYHFINWVIILAIGLATVYSLLSDHSQLFSIIVMSLVLVSVNLTYLLYIRKKN